MKSSLVILYHRQPHDEVMDEDGVIHYKAKQSPNGIVPTLKGFFSNVNQGTWVAWKEVKSKDNAEFKARISAEEIEDGGNYNVRRIALTPEQVKDFYHITSKEAFWPILHSFPYHFTYESSDWKNFHEVNRLFAEAACEEAADDALIWVHDYNLWLVPHYIRQIKPNAKIAFFHHTPFPSVDIFNILPWREEIIDSLLCCNIVGFHIPRYSENFVNVARSLRSVEVVHKGKVPQHLTPVGTALAEPEMTTQLRWRDRLVNVDAFPVGTNPQHISNTLHKPETEERYQEILERLQGRKLIMSAGRVDYVKGVREMLEAYGRLLKRRPELQGKVNMMVTCVSPASGMRVYEEAQNLIEQLVGEINGRFATFEWIPVMLFTQPIPFEDLMCYYRAADVCWTTPLRDGLNLVAKEYVVAREGKGGTLILSEFVGAAVELPEAILTNPYSMDRMDDAINQALDMPQAEQEQRMAKMYKTVTEYDVAHWGDHLFEKFQEMEKNIAQQPSTV